MRVAFAMLALAACGGDDGMVMIDARMADAVDQASCLVPADHGALGTKTGTSGTTGGTTATMTIDAGPPRDTFFVKMVSGKGVFSGGVVPGTFTISGVDAEYNNCGLCVHIIADIVAGVGPTKFYFASAGTVTLTSTTPPIAGSAQDLMFREVDIGSGQPIGSCASIIGSISFMTN